MVGGRRARTERGPSFRDGIVDTSMYVAVDRRSKTAACMEQNKLHRIFRKLRLAVLRQSCRLPIGAGQPLGWHWVTRFPFCAAKCLVRSNRTGATPLVSLRLRRPNMGTFWAAS